MEYYDIHTHQQPSDMDVIAIVNTIVKEGIESNTSRYCSYGIHPWYISNLKEQLNELHKYIILPNAVAIGEAGLDKISEAEFSLQEKAFLEQVNIAEEIRKPLIIHCVKAWTELLAVRKKINPSIPWIIHGFRGKKELAEQLMEHGMYLSFGENFNPEAVKSAWPDRILAETDDKEISIAEVYNHIADTLNLSLPVVASKLAENSRNLFAL